MQLRQGIVWMGHFHLLTIETLSYVNDNNDRKLKI